LHNCFFGGNEKSYATRRKEKATGTKTTKAITDASMALFQID